MCSNNNLAFNTLGNCTITASQAGNEFYFSAEASKIIHIGDSDAVSNYIEDEAPNNGDGNADGKKDSEQENVISSPNENINYAFITLEVSSSADGSRPYFEEYAGSCSIQKIKRREK